MMRTKTTRINRLVCNTGVALIVSYCVGFNGGEPAACNVQTTYDIQPISASNGVFKDVRDLDVLSVRRQKTADGNIWVRARVMIHAPANIVWYAIHEERQHDPDLEYSKIVEPSNNGNMCIIEQKFLHLPLTGSAVCLLATTEIPMSRIDFRLVKSDRLFKAVDGSWALAPCRNGQFTLLDLSSHVDLDVPIPKSIMNITTTRKLERRLARVKTLAEQMNADALHELKR